MKMFYILILYRIKMSSEINPFTEIDPSLENDGRTTPERIFDLIDDLKKYLPPVEKKYHHNSNGKCIEVIIDTNQDGKYWKGTFDESIAEKQHPEVRGLILKCNVILEGNIKRTIDT